MQAVATTGERMRLLDTLLRHRLALLAGLALVLLLASWAGSPAATDWVFFDWGSDTLFGARRDFVRGAEIIPSTGSGGLHLYADYPFLQIGPPALVLAKALQIGPRDGAFLAGAVIQGLGLLLVAVLDRTRPGDRVSRTHTLVCGALLLVVWTSLAHTRHLDDALALTGMTAAVVAVYRERCLMAGVLLGLAAASKPWAVAALPLALGLPGWRPRARAVAVAIGVIGVCWGPFVLADLGTLDLGRVALPFGLDSAPAALGATGLADSEQLRLLQFLGGLAVAAIVSLLGQWQLAPLAAFSFRLLIEPFPYQYYMASLATAALIAELGLERRRVLGLTAVVVGAWSLISVVPPPTGGLVRLLVFGGLLVLPVASALVSFLLRRRSRAPG